jgi:CRP/FNR family transcriptional regulator, cyclic AMP receptor protein
MHALIPKCPLLENFSQPEVLLLAQFMEVYRAPPGAEIIREGAGGDFMLMLLEGRIEVHKRDRWNTPQLLASVESGRTLGEMSMIDGEPRFATCVAAEPSLIAVLDRESLARIIVEQPLLGAKVLMELVLMLSHRLRATSQRLLGLLDEQSQGGAPNML